MFQRQIMKILGGAALTALLFTGVSTAWAQSTTALPAPPQLAASAPAAPPAPAGPLAGPGVPPMPGPLPGGPEAMANTQAGAAREITHAYQAIADATGAISSTAISSTAISSTAISSTADIDALAGQMVTHSKTLYGQAYTSYNDKSWFAANETAKAAVSAADVANHIAKSANSAPTTVPDLQAPPVITDGVGISGTVPPLDDAQQRAAHELTHTYNAIFAAKATAAANTKLTDADFYLTGSETLYKAAYDAYTAKAYNQAAELAHAAHSATDVISHLGNAATGNATPGAPVAPPAPNF